MIALLAAIGVHFRPLSYFWRLADKSHSAPAFLAFAGSLIRSAGRIGLHKPQTTTDINAARQPFTGRKTVAGPAIGVRRTHAGFGWASVTIQGDAVAAAMKETQLLRH
jgi:hypothetical protein